MNAPIRHHTSPHLAVVLGLGLAVFLYMVLFGSQHYTPDGINNLTYIERDNHFELWHPQHLLGLPPSYLVYMAAGGALRAWEAMRLTHAVFAGATVAVLYLALHTLTGRGWLALGGALTLCLSYGFWHFSGDPDIYSGGYLAVALLMLAYVRYLPDPSARRLGWLALAAAFAILMHQMNVELAGLIGLTLVWLAWRRRVGWGAVLVYGAVSILVPVAAYALAWLDVRAYVAGQGQPPPGLVEWALRYFNAARSGAETWGVTLTPESLPVAVYAVVRSWVLPDLSDPVWYGLFAGLALGVAGLALAAWRVLPRLDTTGRLVALVSLLTVAANWVSGWWWQAGNLKFYLFMQLHLILVVALILAAPGSPRVARLRRVAAGLLVAVLGVAHVVYALPYETRGGTFAVEALYAGGEGERIYFEDTTQARLLRWLRDGSGRELVGDFCAEPPPADDLLVVWVVSADTAADCPALAGALFVHRYRFGPERAWWEVYEVARPVS